MCGLIDVWRIANSVKFGHPANAFCERPKRFHFKERIFFAVVTVLSALTKLSYLFSIKPCATLYNGLHEG